MRDPFLCHTANAYISLFLASFIFSPTNLQDTPCLMAGTCSAFGLACGMTSFVFDLNRIPTYSHKHGGALFSNFHPRWYI